MIVDVSPPGTTVELDWRPVAGATRAELTQWSLTIAPRVVVQSLGTLDHEPSGDERIVRIPPGERIRTLAFADFRYTKRVNDENRVFRPRNTEELRDQGLRLVVRVPDGSGWSPPVYAMPALDRQGMVPKLLRGAKFVEGVLTLPDLAVSRLLISLATGSAPNNFEPREFTFDRITGEAAVLPRDLTVSAPDGSVLWAFPGDLPATLAPVTIDLRRAGERMVNAALGAGQAPRARVHIAAARRGEIEVTVNAPHGALSRVVPDTLRIELDGDPVLLPVSPPLSERPAQVAADLRVRYRGLRLHRDLSDAMPAPTSGGVIVGEKGVVRAFPPAAFAAALPARVALIGRAAEDCELVVELVDHAAGVPGAILATATASIAAARWFAYHWFELPAAPASSGAIAVRARTNRGRFFWAGEPMPRLRVAVADSDPGGHPLRIGGVAVADIRKLDHVERARELGGAFHGGQPIFESDLFLTVELSGLTMRHAR